MGAATLLPGAASLPKDGELRLVLLTGFAYGSRDGSKREHVNPPSQ